MIQRTHVFPVVRTARQSESAEVPTAAAETHLSQASRRGSRCRANSAGPKWPERAQIMKIVAIG
jgi:hypothetical protein